MNWVLGAAAYFVLWWLVLFVTLPLGSRSHEEEGEDVTLGTISSAPPRPRLLYKILLTTIIATVIAVLSYVLTSVYGYSFDDIPNFVPQ